MNTGMSWTGCKKPLIDVVDVCKRFRLQREKQRSIQDAFIHFWRRSQSAPEYFWPLRNLSLRVCAGDSIGVLGQNGSGKSTLLKVITGVLPPTSGRVEIHGRVASDRARKCLFERFDLWNGQRDDSAQTGPDCRLCRDR